MSSTVDEAPSPDFDALSSSQSQNLMMAQRRKAREDAEMDDDQITSEISKSCTNIHGRGQDFQVVRP